MPTAPNFVAGRVSQPPVTPSEGEDAPGRPTTIPTEPSIDDLIWVTFVRDKFQRARAHRRPRVVQWLKNYKILNDSTWSDNRPGWMPRPEVNELADIVDSWVAWVTDQRPTISTKGFAQPSSPYAQFMSTLGDDLSHVMSSLHENEDYDMAIENVVADAATYGIGWFKTTWDPLRVGGLGNPIVRRVDPFAVYPDPDATSQYDMSYIIEARTISMAEVERRFGKKVAQSLQTAGYEETVDQQPNLIKGPVEHAKATPGQMIEGHTPSYGLPGQNAGRVSLSDAPGVTILEGWFREYQTYEVNGIDYRYETWRCVIISGNHVLFNEVATDMWHHGDQPFTRYVLKERGEFYGTSVVELLIPIQLSINRLLAHIEQNIWLTGNPVFKEDPRAGISRTKITNQPGQRIPVNAGGTAEWLAPPQIHPQMALQYLKFYVDEMMKIAGLTAQTRGQLPAGRNSTEVLDDVQEGSFVKIRVALRNLERGLRRSYTLAASLVVEFYDTPRMMAILGPEGEESSLALKAKHFYLPAPDDDVQTMPMRFTLSVNAGSSLPTSRIAKAQEADVLFAMGALDVEAVLEAHAWPGRAKIAQRIQKAMAEGTFQPPGARQRTQRQQ